jgi:hypothetical protein
VTRPRAAHQTRGLVVHRPPARRPRGISKRGQRVTRDRRERPATRKARLGDDVRLDEEDNEDTRADKDAALNPEVAGQENETEEDRLEGEERSEATQEPDLKQPARLGVCSCKDIAD